MPTLQPPAADAALARAVVYRMLSVGFQPPTERRLDEIGARDGFRAVVAAVQYLDPQPGGCASAAGRLATLAVPDAHVLAASFWHLFGHTTRGLICACETEYGPDNGFHQPQQLADIAGYYLAFGLSPVVAGDTRADHIACECEFMDFLSRKQAHLLDRRDADADVSETLEVTEMAERSFLREHLGRFGRAFAARVAAEDGDGYFGALGRLLLAFVDAECARVGVEAGPVDLIVRPDEPDDTPMACGTADELLQIQRHP
jgi:TorA maturation chaperone TorD